MSRTTKAQNAKNNRAYRQRQLDEKKSLVARNAQLENRLNETFLEIASLRSDLNAAIQAKALLVDQLSRAIQRPRAVVEEFLEYRQMAHRLLRQVPVDTADFLTLEEIYPQTKRLPNG
jgi:hypothetical protein